MVYKWKTEHFKTDANIAGKVCEELKNKVGLTAENLVNASRDESAPLHNEFEWNDSIAAEEYRNVQARGIIRNLTIVIEDKGTEPVRAFFPVYQEEKDKNEYEPISMIMAEPKKRNSLLEMALRELVSFQRKYQMLTELAEVFEAIEAVKEREGA